MVNADFADTSHKITADSDREAARERTLMIDRTVPGWAVVVGSAFTLAISCCVLGIVLVTIFMQRTIITGGEARMSLSLLGLAVALAVGIMLLEFAQTKALWGFRQLRENQSIKINAFLAIPSTLVVFFVHPLAGAIIPIVSGIGIAILWHISKTTVSEAAWVFEPKEATAILAGRDQVGAKLSQNNRLPHPLSAGVIRTSMWIAIGAGVSVGSYLVAERVLMPGIVIGLTLLSAWNVSNALKFAQSEFEKLSNRVTEFDPEHFGETPDELTSGLNISGLSVHAANGKKLLSDIHAEIKPGEIIGLIGESGGGKSLLLKAISDPTSLKDAEVTGRVSVNGYSIWAKTSSERPAPLVYVADEPIVLPVAGSDNLSCFQQEGVLERGKYFLEQFVFARDLVSDICATEDAETLPSLHKKCLSLARAFAISPMVYLFDHPESSLRSPQISVLCNRLEQEARLGRSIIVVSQDRAILEKCDRLFVLQAGTITDSGAAQEVKDRMDTGWHRFVGRRELRTDQSLEEWIRSHFRRNGDEDNRRKVSRISSELLALSCSGPDQSLVSKIEFLFKNYQGYCILKLVDDNEAVTSVQIQQAQDILDHPEKDTGRNPLANVMKDCVETEFNYKAGQRIIHCKIETYDPRKFKR